jgi:hypothetical protein
MNFTKKTLGLALVSTLALGAFGCASSGSDDTAGGDSAITGGTNTSPTKDKTAETRAPAATAKEIRASRDPKLAMIPFVRQITPIESPDATLRIYQTGGGDPAMNGVQLWLGAHGEPTADAGSMFELHLDINTLQKAEQTSLGKIRLTGLKDEIDANGDIRPKAFAATVTYTLADGVIAPSVQVETAGTSRTENAATEASDKAVLDVFKVSPTESEQSGVVHVYETTKGDPAMNGVSVLLTIEKFPASESRTFDLGLDIAGVRQIDLESPFELRIQASEDEMSKDGDIQPKAVSYSVTFSITNDNVAEVIQLRRL